MTVLSVLLALVALVVCGAGIVGGLPSRGERYATFVAATFGCWLVVVSDRTFLEALGLALAVTALAAIAPRLAEDARHQRARERVRAERAMGPMVPESPEGHD